MFCTSWNDIYVYNFYIYIKCYIYELHLERVPHSLSGLSQSRVLCRNPCSPQRLSHGFSPSVWPQEWGSYRTHLTGGKLRVREVKWKGYVIERRFKPPLLIPSPSRACAVRGRRLSLPPIPRGFGAPSAPGSSDSPRLPQGLRGGEMPQGAALLLKRVSPLVSTCRCAVVWVWNHPVPCPPSPPGPAEPRGTGLLRVNPPLVGTVCVILCGFIKMIGNVCVIFCGFVTIRSHRLIRYNVNPIKLGYGYQRK